ncbi:complex I subunit 5 family protein [Natronospira sp.]|uniref:complex I subunit 5 family protein n=1 Tax=Natronospira sp. TaxID=2024970 RepID=UPI0038731DC9
MGLTELSILLPVLMVFGPLLLALLVFLAQWQRSADWLGMGLGLILLALVTPFSGAVLLEGPLEMQLGGHDRGLAIPFYVDGLTLAMLWLNTLLFLFIQVYAGAWLQLKQPAPAAEFRPLFLLLWSGLNALFLSGDLFNLYVTLEITTLAAVPLVILSHGHAAMAAAMRYLLFALVGSIIFLLGVALVYAQAGLLSLPLLQEQAEPHPALTVALLAMTAGVAMKAALFPVHAWLPEAHASAPSPASALLSALVAKAAAYLILRLWMGPLEAQWTPAMAQLMGALGAAGIIYASIQALRQTRLKRVIAYSTVAQLGYLLLLIPMASVLAWNGVIYHALTHGLAKAALFLAAGNLIMVLRDDSLRNLAGCDQVLSKNILVIGLAGVAIAGLPPTGGFIAKWWLISAALESGQWWWAVVIGLGGLLAAAYIFRILSYAFFSPDPHQETPIHQAQGQLTRALVWPPVILAFLAIALGMAGGLLAPFLEIAAPVTGAQA